MKRTLRMSRPALMRCWGVCFVAALLLFALFSALEAVLKARSGVGIADLHYAASGYGVRNVLDHWQNPRDMGLAGILLGFDGLFILVTTAALYFGALAAREVLAPEPGARRRLLDALTWLPLLAGIGDLTACSLHAFMMVQGASEVLTAIAWQGATVNAAGALVGVALSLAAALGLVFRRRVKG